MTARRSAGYRHRSRDCRANANPTRARCALIDPTPATTLAREATEDVGWRSGPGARYPLGATFDGSGTNFALFSEVAEKVELCLFDEPPGG